MATETVLFSQYIGNLGETDSVYIRLSSDSDISVNSISPIRMELTEMFNAGSPMIAFEFTDGNGDLVNHTKPSMTATYFLDIGSSPLDASRLKLRCSKIALVNQRAGASAQIAFKMFFVVSSWHEFSNKKKNRAWKDKLHSEIVSEIAKDSFTDTDITPTTSSTEFFVQPHWSDLQAIRYLRNKSLGDTPGHMEFGVTLAGKFIFKSTGDMITEKTIQAKKKEIPVFRMEGQISDEVLRKEAYDKNKAPTYFMNFSAEEEYSDAIGSGGGGASAMYFDANTGSFNTTSVTYSASKVPQMSDWAGVHQVDENTGVRVYGGRDVDVIAEATNIVVDIVDSINKFEIITEKALSTHIADLVEVIIPIPPSVGSILPQNMFYSGFYLVCAVSHTINFSKSTILSTISLMREGFDGKQLQGYVKSQAGKFV